MTTIQLSGTIYNTVQLSVSESKWQQKRLERNQNAEMTEEQRQLKTYEEDMKRIQEGNRTAELQSKLESGASLTPEEMDYLREKNPEAIKEYEEEKREQETYKNELKNCHTKEEVEKVKQDKMSSFLSESKRISENPNIPKAKKLELLEKIVKRTNGINQVHAEYTKSVTYQNKPTEQEALQKEKVQNDVPDTESEETVEKPKTVAQSKSDVNTEEDTEQDDTDKNKKDKKKIDIRI